MNLQNTLATLRALAHQPDGLFHGIQLIGFTKAEQELIRATMSRLPMELISDNVKRVVADRTMGAKHGRFIPETQTVLINPTKFSIRQRLGRGPGWVMHWELTMVHEFGHAIFEALPYERKQEWYDISGWVKEHKQGNAPPYVEKRPGWEHVTSQWTHKKGVRFTRHYAERNPDEDAADSFAFMMLNKGFQMDPKKKAWWDAVIQSKVHRYPTTSIESPARAYGERGN
jgi:hypothetical protein